jgi:mannose-6-phosphate isomerase-like protein (cupin superfamily)
VARPFFSTIRNEERTMARVPNSPAFLRIQADPGKLVLHASDIETLTVYEWEEHGEQQNAFGDEDVEVPYGAAKIELQLYNFPTCQLRKIYFPKLTRTPWHPNHDDIILYSVDAHQVEFVGTQSFHAQPGDATLHPVGVDHHSETLRAGWRLEFSFDAQPGKCGRDLIALPARDMLWHEITEWVEDGQRRQVIGPCSRPGTKYRAKMFHFPVYTMFECRYPQGDRLALHTNATEKLIYVLEGRLRITTDTVTDELTAGSMARIPAGRPYAREALTDCVAIDLDGYTTPQPYPRHD